VSSYRYFPCVSRLPRCLFTGIYRYRYQQDPLNSQTRLARKVGTVQYPVRRLNSLVAGYDGIETDAARCYRGGLSHTYLSARKWPGTVAIRAS
jgi:hypothetical protein